MKQSATPPRRWFSFRLRTLFVVVTVAAVLLRLGEIARLEHYKRQRARLKAELDPIGHSWVVRHYRPPH